MVRKKLSAFALAMAMIITMFSMFSITGRSAEGSVDSYGYTWVDSNSPEPTVSFDWIEINDTMDDSGVSGDDESGGPFNIGFDFSYYGQIFTVFNISTNGFITFGETGSYPSNDEIPSPLGPNGVIAAYWTDLIVDPLEDSAIYVKTIGAAPERQLVVEYYKVRPYDCADPMSFEIVLNETGEIWLKYGYIAWYSGFNATVGIESPDGLMGCEYSYWMDSLSSDLAIKFYSVDVLIGPPQSSEVLPGDVAEYVLTVTNSATSTDSFDIELVSDQGWSVEYLDDMLNPLVDSNSNGVIDTGDIAPKSSKEIIVRVSVPALPLALQCVMEVIVTSYNNPASSGSTYLTTSVLEAVFAPPHDDFVNDTDSDGLFNTLSVNASLMIYVAGTYSVYAELFVPSFGIASSAFETASLDIGVRVIILTFDARILNACETDGPYSVTMSLSSAASGNLSQTSSHETAAYSWAAFDPPELRFNTPFADYGDDTNGDLFYEALVIEATVDVLKDGNYEINAELTDVYGEHVQSLTNDSYLTIGTHVIEFRFQGTWIWYYYHNGPFEVGLWALDDSMVLMDEYNYTTSEYLFLSFQPYVALSTPYSDYGLDDGASGLFDYLVVVLPVDVSVSGYYYFDYELYDQSYEFIDSNMTSSWLSEGYHEVSLLFDGKAIRSALADGPYLTVFQVYDASSRLMCNDTYTTNAYSFTEFESRAVFVLLANEYVTDVDGDGLYDHLVFEFVVEIFSAGYYTELLYLYNGSGYLIAYPIEIEYLEVGNHTVEFSIMGCILWSHGYNGTYTAIAKLLNPSSWDIVYDEYEHVTDAYGYDQFEPNADLLPPYSDHGLDSNGDGYYEYLVLEISMNITITGDYEIVWTCDNENGTYIAFDSTGTLHLEYGIQTVEVYMFGQWFYNSGLDGPYTIDITLFSSEAGRMDYDTYVTEEYAHDEFQAAPSTFSDTYSDFPVDDDDDGLYEYLVFVMTVDIITPGEYTISGEMYDNYWWPIQSMDNTTYLESGVQEVEIWFDGAHIAASQRDGYYVLSLYLYDWAGNELDYSLLLTSSYSWTDFDVAASFSPPHGDHGYDDNDDTFYEYLVIEASVNVCTSDNFTILATVFDEYDGYLTYAETTEYLEEGTVTVDILIPGWVILENGVDGPFYVELYLYFYGYVIDFGDYTTSYYSFNQFAQKPAQFAPPHGSHGVDDDDDDLYEQMVIELRLNVTVSGEYLLSMEIRSQESWFIAGRTIVAYLSQGLQIVEFAFDGWIFCGLGYDGPYEVDMELSMADGTYLDEDSFETDMYLASEFDPTVPMIYSYWTSDAPMVDGIFSPGEWDDASCVTLDDGGRMYDHDTVMLILNNGTHLFVCIDVPRDTSEDDFDAAILAFDTGNDEILTVGSEDRFLVFGNGDTRHMVYSVMSYWSEHCEPFDPLLADHETLMAAAGFGTSDNSESAHRVYEFCIPLDLIDATSDEVLGFVSGAADYEDESISQWPMMLDIIFHDPSMYGDLVLYSSAPPSTTVSLSGTGPVNGWYISSVEATLDATDDDEGVDCTYYRLDGGEWTEYLSHVTISGDGTHIFEFYSVDSVGNPERVRNVSVCIDMTAPTVSVTPVSTQGDHGWYTSMTDVTFDVSDGSDASGLATLYYRLDGGEWNESELDGVLLFRLSTNNAISEGEHTIEFYATDIAGNEGVLGEFTYKLDSFAPVTSATKDGSRITLSSADGMSGVNVTYYRIDGGDWTAYTGIFEVDGSGNHTVEFYSVDYAGNEEDAVLLYVENGSDNVLFNLNLWELIMVLLVIALIAGIAIPAIFGMRRRAKESDAKAIIKDSVSAVAQLVDDNPSWPPTTDEPLPPSDGETPPKKD